MCLVEFQTVPLCWCIHGFSFCSVPLSSVEFHRIAAIFAAVFLSDENMRVVCAFMLAPIVAFRIVSAVFIGHVSPGYARASLPGLAHVWLEEQGTRWRC
jgi:hypothetical protein